LPRQAREKCEKEKPKLVRLFQKLVRLFHLFRVLARADFLALMQIRQESGVDG
jgi:hypothetical protein